MTMRHGIAAFALDGMLSIGAPSAVSSDVHQRERCASIAQFRHWPGEWKGLGWSTAATGERIEFDLAESVPEKAGGFVLLVEGHGVRTNGVEKGTMTHDGLVLVHRDAAGRCRWNGHEAKSGSVDAEITLRDGGFEWSLRPDPKGPTVRFTIELDDERWREYGEVRGDGGMWSKFMEMTLLGEPR